MFHRNNENVLTNPLGMHQHHASSMMAKKTTTTTSSIGVGSMYEPKKSIVVPSKTAILSRAPLTSIQNRTNEHIPTAAEPAKKQSPVKTIAAQEFTTPGPSVSSPKPSIYAPKRRVLQMESPGIDLYDKYDPQQVGEFVKDIFHHVKNNELKFLPDPNYMQNQPRLTVSMRATLIDWMVDVHRKFRLLPETFFLTINILDRFLCERQINKSKLQLVGVAALLIACKYEEIHYPDVGKLEGICASAFTRLELLHTERVILAVLDFNITVVTPYPFLTRYSKCGKIGKIGFLLALYFTELAALEYEFLRFAPSVIACTALYLSNKFMRAQDPWCVNLQYYTGYNTDDLRECATLMLNVIRTQRSASLKHYAMRNKYLSPTRERVAEIAITSAHLIEL